MLADISMEVAIHLLVFDNVLAWIEMFVSMFLYNVSCKHEHVSEAIAHMYAHIYAYIRHRAFSTGACNGLVERCCTSRLIGCFS